MSELISGKEAWIAKTEKISVQYRVIGIDWQDLSDKQFMNWETSRFLSEESHYEFRLKPQTITLNGIEVPRVKNITYSGSGGNFVKIACHSIEDAAAMHEALRSVFK